MIINKVPEPNNSEQDNKNFSKSDYVRNKEGSSCNHKTSRNGCEKGLKCGYFCAEGENCENNFSESKCVKEA